jgi:hypothetical protein
MQAWGYLEAAPAPDAPVKDNPSGLYCPECRASHMSHCSDPEYCGGMRKMRERESQFEGTLR